MNPEKENNPLTHKSEISIHLEKEPKLNQSAIVKYHTLDDALFYSSTLCYQIGLAVILSMTFNLSNVIKGGFAWLELKPEKALCNDGQGNYTVECDWDKACELGDYKVDTNDEKYLHNWMSEYDQWCTADYKIGLFGTVFFIGYVLGSLTFLPLADYIGRKKVVWINYFAHSTLLLLTVFTLTKGNFLTLIYIYLFLFGFKASMNAQVAYVMLCELVLTKYRPALTTFMHAFDSMTNISLYIYFNYVREWKYVIYFFAALSGAFIFIFFLVPESPRYHVAKGEYESAHLQYDMMARISCRKRVRKPLIGEEETSTLMNAGIQVKKENIKDLFKAGKVALVPLGVITWFWFANNFIYYGLQVGVKYLNGDLFVNGLIMYGAVLLAMFSTGSLANVLGRRLSLVITYSLLLVGTAAYLIVQNQNARYVLLLIAMYGASGAINIDYMVCSELFPTSVRGVVFGIANTSARIGASISPLLEEIFKDDTLYFYAGLGLICLIMVKFLRETKNQPLMTTLDDLQELFGKPRDPEKQFILEESRILRESRDKDTFFFHFNRTMEPHITRDSHTFDAHHHSEAHSRQRQFSLNGKGKRGIKQTELMNSFSPKS